MEIDSIERIEICTFCGGILYDGVNETATMKQKAIQSATDKSRLLGDNKWQMWQDETSLVVHELCRKRYSARKVPVKKKPKLLELVQEEDSFSNVDSTQLQSSTSSSDTASFNFLESCIFCSLPLDEDHNKVLTLEDINAVNKLIGIILGSTKNEENNELIKRLKSSIFTPNFTAKYHADCYEIFIFEIKSNKNSQVEIRVNSNIDCDFKTICKHIEESGLFQFYMKDLLELVPGTSLTSTRLYKKLKNKYGKRVHNFYYKGKQAIIYNEVSNGKVTNKKDEIPKMTKTAILNAAAQILREEVKEFKYMNKSHPPSSRFSDTIMIDVPPLLSQFLDDFLLSENTVQQEHFVKRDFIAHSIVSTLKPSG